MLFRNCLIGSVIIHLLLLGGVGISKPDVRTVPKEEKYLQIYTVPGSSGQASSERGKMQISSEIPPTMTMAQSGPTDHSQSGAAIKLEQARSQPVRLQPVATDISGQRKEIKISAITNLTVHDRELPVTAQSAELNRITAVSSEQLPSNQTVAGTGFSVINGNADQKNDSGNGAAGQVSGLTGQGGGAVANPHLPQADTRPVRVKCPKQQYPKIASQNNWEGTTVLLANVQIDGRVGEVKLDSSSGYKDLDQEAIRTFKKWRYLPATKDGHPVVCQVRVPFIFNLEDQ